VRVADTSPLAIRGRSATSRGGMKLTSLFAAATAALFLCSVSCERHEWEETKALHEKHGHGASHGEDSHGAEGHGAEKAH